MKLRPLLFLSIWTFTLLLGLMKEVAGQEIDTIPPKPEINARLLAVSSIEAAGYVGSMVGLYSMWYKNYPMGRFHLINDNREWLQLDKMGHATTAYYLGKIGYESLRWAGVDEKKATWFGGPMGWIFLTTVEVLDGCSKEWGASPGDVMANTFGTLLFTGQQALWHDQKMMLKWSVHYSPYAKYNPAQLGSNLPERMIKDYNGQTFWISANLNSLGLYKQKLPPWINIAMGYGGEGLTGGYSNYGTWQGNSIPDTERKRQFYLSPDIDLSRVKVKSKTLHLFLSAIGFIKIPMPALELNRSGMRWHWLYF